MPSATIEGSGNSPGELERALNRIVAGLISWARANVVPVIKAERDAYLSRRTGDALRLADDVGANARAIIEGLRHEAERLAAGAQVEASAAIQKEAQRNTRQFIAGVQAQAQIDVTALLRDDDLVDLLSIKSEEANRLITNLSLDVHNRIERETLGAIFEGRSNEQIAKSLQEIDGIGRNRSRLIARDQANKLNNAMNQFRQEQAGVTHYRWKTILDGRERPSHHANNDQVFAWSSPPANTGHPGHDINCRCRALAIITDDPEEIENSATPPDGGEMADFFTANLPAIRSVASVPRTNLGTLSTQDIAKKLAHSIDLQRKLASAGSAFTEKNAEQLVTELYGFLPKDADLEALAGRVRAIFSNRRSVLMAASNERLKLIERALVQARVTNAAALPSTGQPTVTPSVPSVARTYPKGRYFEREVGKAIGADAAEAIAGTFTRLQGRATGHEWAVFHDAEGRIFARMSSGRKNLVNFRSGDVPEVYTRGNKVTLHHNHPGGTSFSAEDLKFLNRAPGLDKMWVHAHDGSSYAARVLNPTGLELAIGRAQRETIIQLKSAVRAGLMAQKEGEAIVAHVRSLVLAETGRIAYEYQLDGKTRKLVDRYQATIDVIVAHIAGTV